MKLILSLLILFVFISCSSNDKSDFDLNQNLYDKDSYDEIELYLNAKKFAKDRQYEMAFKELDLLELIFPSSQYISKGILLNAYIHFLNKDYEKSRALVENFKKYYPGNEDIVYANYLEAMTYYILIKKSNYTQRNSHIALEKFNFILNAYPNSDYEIDIITKIQIINNHLAKNKLSTAKYYIEKNNIVGALVYLKDIFENYNTSLSIEETLFLLSSIYKSINEIELARYYTATLGYNFPESIWYKKSYNLIYGLDDIANKESWIKKFNPIKLIISNKKEEDDTIQIIN